MSAELHHLGSTTHLLPDTIAERNAAIRAELLARSQYIRAPNFQIIHHTDLELLFDGYDAAFFQGALRKALGSVPLYFSLSKKMTRAGGRTRRTVDRNRVPLDHDITISSTILFNCFEDDHRAITVCGKPCSDRLAALQRILEHEITHMAEYLTWNATDCSAPRFRAIAMSTFGHTEHTHSLITPKESAFAQHGIRPGIMVRFNSNGILYTGHVNRVTRRATVLVEDPRGKRYSNGKHYLKFLVPVEYLEAVEV